MLHQELEMVMFDNAIDCNNKIIGVMAQFECNANGVNRLSPNRVSACYVASMEPTTSV